MFLLVGCACAGRHNGGRGYREPRQPDQGQARHPGQPQVVRLEVAVRGFEKDSHHDRDKRRRGGHRSQRDLDVRRRSKAAGDKEKKRKKKKRSSSSSSSGSPSFHHHRRAPLWQKRNRPRNRQRKLLSVPNPVRIG